MTRILAAFIFFTRLPFWRLAEVPTAYFKKVVVFWPLTGWVTAGLTVLILYAALLVLPFSIALILALLSRLLITGCLHEDGLADFLDGTGGGTTKEKVLKIMKDPHTGSYGIIGLIVYFGLLFISLYNLAPELAACAILAGDPFSKGVAAQLINRLPYARNEEESKNKTVYDRMNTAELLLCSVFGLFPLFWLPSLNYLWAAVFPVITWIWLTLYIRKKIGGYTGDCCGAVFLICEVSFYVGMNFWN